MKRIFGYLSAVVAALFGTGAMAADAPAAALPELAAGSVVVPAGMNPENMLVLELKDGVVLIELYPDAAPNSVARIKELARKGFYDGLTFHRVIEGFMAQTGDPKGDGTGGSGQKLKAEFNDHMHLRGTMSMARAEDPDSADSQFFIMLRPNFALNNKYTVVGRVVTGMEAVDLIKRGEGPAFTATGNPDKILRLRVAADVPGLVTAEAAPTAAPTAEAAPAEEVPAEEKPAEEKPAEDQAGEGQGTEPAAR